MKKLMRVLAAGSLMAAVSVPVWAANATAMKTPTAKSTAAKKAGKKKMKKNKKSKKSMKAATPTAK